MIVCAGLGARTLGGVEDENVYPIRGQTVLVRAPWIRFGRTMSGNGEEAVWTYIIPRRSGDVSSAYLFALVWLGFGKKRLFPHHCPNRTWSRVLWRLIGESHPKVRVTATKVWLEVQFHAAFARVAPKRRTPYQIGIDLLTCEPVNPYAHSHRLRCVRGKLFG